LPLRIAGVPPALVAALFLAACTNAKAVDPSETKASATGCFQVTPSPPDSDVQVRHSLEEGTDCTVGAVYRLGAAGGNAESRAQISVQFEPAPTCAPRIEVFSPETNRWIGTHSSTNVGLNDWRVLVTTVRVPARIRIVCREEQAIDAGTNSRTSP